MHSYDRTLLAKLGFSDPDKANDLHDLACQYVGQAERVKTLTGLLGLEHGRMPYRRHQPLREIEGANECQVLGHRIGYEVPIEKGTGQYKTTIGFMDVLLTLRLLRTDHGYRLRVRNFTDVEWGPWHTNCDGRMEDRIRVGIEVKIAPVPVGALIRQINLYKSYTNSDTWSGGVGRWIVVTDFGVSRAELESLSNEGIIHVRLGPGFDEFVAEQRQASADESPVVI